MLSKDEKTKSLLAQINSFIAKCRSAVYNYSYNLWRTISGEDYGLLIILAGEPAEYGSSKFYSENHHKMFIVEKQRIEDLCKLVIEKWGIKA